MKSLALVPAHLTSLSQKHTFFSKRNENLKLEGNAILDSQVASMHIK